MTTKQARAQLLHQMSAHMKFLPSKMKLSFKGGLKVSNITVFSRNSASAMFQRVTSALTHKNGCSGSHFPLSLIAYSILTFKSPLYFIVSNIHCMLDRVVCAEKRWQNHTTPTGQNPLLLKWKLTKTRTWYTLRDMACFKPFLCCKTLCGNIHFVAEPTIVTLSHFDRNWEPAERIPENVLVQARLHYMFDSLLL